MSTFHLLREFQSLGCTDQHKIALASRVFQNLQITKKCTNIDKAYEVDLELVYIIGKQADKTHIFIPLLSTQELEMFKLERIQNKLKEIYKDSILHLAICDTASNVLYYTITPTFLDNVDLQTKR